MGSFPPPGEWDLIGSNENYFIHDGYAHRKEPSYFDDTASSTEYQVEVYQYAREVFDKFGLKSVCDIGCGSGFKLMSSFGNAETIGVDVPETCAHLRKRWPDRRWIDGDFHQLPPFQADLVIAADVIEHLANPDGMLSYIERIRPRYAVISTPERNLLRSGTHDGPPHNGAHLREWSYAEFRAYIDSRFTVDAHFVSWAAQATQCVLCRPR
jgi:ubiquinone/menaquinone biosynthesis C-methylase UbiE